MVKILLFLKYYLNILSKTKRNYIKMLRKKSYKERFKEIYKKNLWGNKESVSGDGSSNKCTENIKNWLPLQILKYNIKTIVDAPCGDFNWMKNLVLHKSIEYNGIDIVDELIEKNRIKNQNNKNIEFTLGDICESKIPDCDLLIVRDCLFHLSYKEIDRFLKNIEKTKYKYLLTSTHNKNLVKENYDIISGDFRFINLFSNPFNFNENMVIERVNDCLDLDIYKREMILLKKANVPKALS